MLKISSNALFAVWFTLYALSIVFLHAAGWSNGLDVVLCLLASLWCAFLQAWADPLLPMLKTKVDKVAFVFLDVIAVISLGLFATTPLLKASDFFTLLVFLSVWIISNILKSRVISTIFKVDKSEVQ